MGVTDLEQDQVRNFYGLLQSVKTISVAPVTLSGLQTINGYGLQEGERVFLNAQTDAIENGIWNASSGAWERAGDSEEGDDLGTVMFMVTHGNNAKEIWEVQQDLGSGIVGTDAISSNLSVVTPSGKNTDYYTIGTLNVNNDDHIQDNTLIYKSWSKFIFAGLENLLPAVSARAIVWVDNSNKPCDFRIRDITNNNTIVEILGINNETPDIIELTNVQNLPLNESIFEAQLRTQQVGGKYNFSGFAIGTNM